MGSLLKVFYRWVLVIKATLDRQTHCSYFDVEVNTGHPRKATAVYINCVEGKITGSFQLLIFTLKLGRANKVMEV